ncbi:transcriptional regulator [Pectobacterium brasiliense]|uniref:transcriptional regulator n=2 Tax=Pectobacterium brasiliense TaxID=180957 RepID=UPI00300E4A18
MLSQLTLRFPKTLIERLKNRAATEKSSVNALAERMMETGLQGSAVSEEYLRLATDPDETLRQLYRKLILGQTLGAPQLSRDTLQFMTDLAHQGYARGQSQLVNLSRLRVLLDITGELLAWQMANHQPVDSHYLKSTFGLAGDDLPAEYAQFLTQLSPAISQDYAEHLLRPLASRAFDLHEIPDEVLATLFTRPRLKAIFPLCMYARHWDFDTRRRFMDQVRPILPAINETIDAGTVKLDLRIRGQEPDTRPGGWYETPRLFLVVQGKDFLMPFGHEQFSELLRTLTVYHTHPAVLNQGWNGQYVMFSTRETAGNDVVVGLDSLRIWVPEAGFTALASALVTHCGQGTLATVLDDLNCLYGDL